MQIPLALLLFIYILAVAAFLLFFISHMYHMTRYSFWNMPGYIMTSLLILLSLGTLVLSVVFMKRIDWGIQLTLPYVFPTTPSKPTPR